MTSFVDQADPAGELELGIDVQVAPAFEGRIAADRLKRAAAAALRHENTPGDVTLVITDDLGIQELNRDFLGIDAPTDVLSFSAREPSGPFVAAPDESAYLGDVIVAYPYAQAQAGELGHPVEQELDLLVVHGVLHLLGYDHATEDEETVMWAKQDEILSGLAVADR